MGNRIPVPLELDDFEVEDAQVVNGTLEVRVRSTFPRACHHCGSMSVIGHGRNERRIRHCAIGRQTVLLWNQRRYRCVDCGRTCRERHPEIAGQRSITARFRWHLFERACSRPFAHVAADEGVTGYRVVEAFEAHAEAALVCDFPLPRVLSLDESAFRRRRRFQTVVCDPEHRTLLALGDGRDRSSTLSLLESLDPGIKSGVETVVIDCHWGFRQAVEEHLPGVRLVADRFHVQRSIDQAALKVRVRCGRKPRQLQVGRDGGTARQKYPRNYPNAFQIRHVFAKRGNRLSVGKREWLESVLWSYPDMHLAWELKEQFRALYKNVDPDNARNYLKAWCTAALRSRIPAFGTLALRIRKHFDGIVAAVEWGLSNSRLEGINAKIRLINNRAHGHKTAKALTASIYLSLGGITIKLPTQR